MLGTMLVIYLKERCNPVLLYHVGLGKNIRRQRA